MNRKLAAVARGLKQLDDEGLKRVRDYRGTFLLGGTIYSSGKG